MAAFSTLVVITLAALAGLSHAAPAVAPVASGAGSSNPHTNFLRAGNLPASFAAKFNALSAEAKKVAEAKLAATHLTEAEADTVFIHSTGQIYVADPVPEIPAEVVQARAQAKEARRNTVMISDETSSTFSSTGVPLFHSLPGAPNMIFLDFDGYSSSSSAWGAFTGTAFDPSNNGAAFDANEQAAIRDIWRRVAEDYSPFNVDVTTDDPWAAASGTSAASAVANNRVVHSLITKHVMPSGAAMPSSTAGGISFVGVFGQSNYAQYSPSFVYWDNLLGGESDAVAEAASHEAGHNFGLSHDGTSTSGYYGGAGSGAESWAPIMGAAYFQDVSVFNPGDYPDANNQEDDIAIISNWLGFRPDDVGNTAAAATALTSDNTGAFATTGIISSRGDVDYYKITVGSGALSLSALAFQDPVFTRGANLDIRMELYDHTGTNMLTYFDQPTTQDASITTTVAAGTYYVAVRGVGGALYTSYDSLGQYDLSGTSVPAVVTTTAAPATTTTKAPATTVKAASTSSCSCPASGPKWQSKGTAQLKVPFKVTCSTGYTFNVCLQDVVQGAASNTNYVLQLYSGSYTVASNLRASSDSSNTANECINYRAPASDAVSGNAYYVVVRSTGTGAISSWSLMANTASVSTCN